MTGWTLGYKKLYRNEDVIKATNNLIKQNGLTTTDQVVAYLRQDNFWAVAREVEIVLDALCDEGTFQHDYNAPRTYFFPLD